MDRQRGHSEGGLLVATDFRAVEVVGRPPRIPDQIGEGGQAVQAIAITDLGAKYGPSKVGRWAQGARA